MGKITVLTSITGNKDSLVEEQPKGDYLAYLSNLKLSETWQTKLAPAIYKDDRRNSRLPKMLPHLYCDSEYSIWIDGNETLLKPPTEIIDLLLRDHDIALFKHPVRDCIYDEALRCAKAKLDDPEVIIEQVTRYEKEGYAKHKGLFECGFIVRRHTKKVVEFNNMWHAEYSRGSCRDQISFAYVADKVGLRINAIDAPWYLDESNINVQRGGLIKMVPHLLLNPPVHV